ncbi:MAG: SH3-like domain-containing protein [Thermoleophilaceae bacterium]
MSETRFRLGDRVTVRDATTLFHTRTQAFTRNKTGVVVEHRPAWVIPEDEAWGRDTEETGRNEPFYVVRFHQKDLWNDYTGSDNDTLETEISEHWLEPEEG